MDGGATGEGDRAVALAVKYRDKNGRSSDAKKVNSEIAGTSQSACFIFFTFPVGLNVSCPIRLPKDLVSSSL